MKKFPLLFVLSLALCSARADTKLNVFSNGKKIGTAVYKLAWNKDGGKTEGMVSTIKGPQGMVTSTQSVTYDRQGRTLKRVDGQKLGKMSQQVSITFDTKGAHVKLPNGKVLDRSIPKGMKNFDPSQYWILKTKPKVGEQTKSASFSLRTMAWEEITTTYLGKKTVTVGGKNVSAHAIKLVGGGETTTAYLDEKGQPYMFIQGDIRFERA